MAVRLSQRGYAIVAAASRTFASAEKLAAAVPGCRAYPGLQSAADAADLVFITTPDAAIGTVAGSLKWRSGQSVCHCSGADSLDVLKPAVDSGAVPGGFHPLQTFASAAQAIENLPGSTFGIEASEPLLSVLKKMANDLHGSWVELKAGDKVLYHAAAVISCNYMVTLVKMASDLWQNFGVPPAQAIEALMPLLRGTLNNLAGIGLPGALTGPIARGDTGTVRKHLAALGKSAPRLLSTYRELGMQTVPIAAAKGKCSPAAADELISLFRKTQERDQ
jgi:predicted short-subunit dehydrogenase-like oxidoreductase (DUF2520 family)